MEMRGLWWAQKTDVLTLPLSHCGNKPRTNLGFFLIKTHQLAWFEYCFFSVLEERRIPNFRPLNKIAVSQCNLIKMPDSNFGRGCKCALSKIQIQEYAK